jgi:hypothetical protein
METFTIDSSNRNQIWMLLLYIKKKCEKKQEALQVLKHEFLYIYTVKYVFNVVTTIAVFNMLTVVLYYK